MPRRKSHVDTFPTQHPLVSLFKVLKRALHLFHPSLKESRQRTQSRVHFYVFLTRLHAVPRPQLYFLPEIMEFLRVACVADTACALSPYLVSANESDFTWLCFEVIPYSV
ncbi:hypothetical protein SDJN02_03146, partial [Cucurbita argyrosperma subsp. argyrosperma]